MAVVLLATAVSRMSFPFCVVSSISAIAASVLDISDTLSASRVWLRFIVVGMGGGVRFDGDVDEMLELRECSSTLFFG